MNPSPFDRIYCVSLPRSTERREHAIRELGRVGLAGFEFFDATDRDSPLIGEYRARNAVATFPPCFRCGRKVCDCENNVLIDEQVATFITYQMLWEKIARESTDLTLIVEDDIKFPDYARNLLATALTPENLLACGMRPENEALLRLGWALCEDHTWNGSYRFVPGLLKMSNPAFAITQATARRLQAAAGKIDTTVDIFIHQEVGQAITSHTLLPPLAYELSWSTGAFPSLIRSKPIRVQYLRQTQPGNPVAAGQAEAEVKVQITKIHSRPFLCVGHPRCGSGYMAQLLKALGLDVGHERMGIHGISSWMFAADDDRYPFALDEAAATRRDKHFDYIIHHVRNPRMAIPSIMVENRYSAASYEFRRRHILKRLNLDLNAFANEAEQAAVAYLSWNRLIEQMRPHLVVRVENCEEDVRGFLTQRNLVPPGQVARALPPRDINAHKPYQGKVIGKPVLQPSDWAELSAETILALAKFCHEYGYPDVTQNEGK